MNVGESRHSLSAHEKKTIISIVAVHGLNPFNTEFHAEKTWTSGDKLWLRDFLPAELPQARVLLYGYNSNVALETSIIGVREVADNLLNRLHLKRRGNSDVNRPIIFIAHSLGGIIVKQVCIFIISNHLSIHFTRNIVEIMEKKMTALFLCIDSLL